jgi:hypothetical protein
MGQGENRSWIILLLAIFGLAALPAVRSRSGAPRKEPSAQADPAARADAADEGEARLIRIVGKSAGLVGNRSPASLADLRRQVIGAGDQHRLTVLVMTVPNPRRTRFGWYFDQAMDNLLAAAGDRGLLLDRSDIPWRREASAAPGTPTPPALRHQPGLVVLRNDSHPAELRLVVVLLVGESPVEGVDREALASALAWAHELAPGELRVLGPYFSGAALSLAQTLEQRPDPEARVRIVSGSATSASLDQALALSGVTFSRTVLEDEQLWTFLCRAVGNRSKGPPRIALLSESGTSFGEQIAERGQKVENGCTPTVFRYPLHVAALRAEWEKENAQDAASSHSLRRTLELNFASRGDDSRDMVPVFSELSKFGVELALRQTLSSIAREHFSYLAITGSDPTDVVFLAREARRFAPGVQLLTLGSEQVYGHPDLTSDLRGMVIASSYALATPDRSWASLGPPPCRWVPLSRHSFVSQSGQGIYNAALTLLSEMSPAPGGCPALLGSALEPRPWLSMVSGAGLWPLATRVEPGDAQERADILHVTFLVWGLRGLVALGLVAQLGASWRRRRRRRPPPRGSEALYEGIGLFVLLLGALLLSLPGLLLPGLRGERVATGAGLIIAGVLWAFVIRRFADALAWSGPRGRWGTRRWVPLMRLVAWIGTATVILGAAGAWGAKLFQLDRANRLLFVSRFVDPLGLSPLAPLLLVAVGIYVWSRLALRRARNVRHFPRIHPFPDGSPPGFDDLRDAVRGQEDARRWSRPYRLVAPVVVLCGIFFCARLFPTFEVSGFDLLIEAALLILFAVAAAAFVRFVILSRQLLHALRFIAGTPLVESYDRIGAKVTSAFGLRFLSRLIDVDELQSAAMIYQSLAALASSPAMGPALREAAAERTSLQVLAPQVRRSVEPAGRGHGLSPRQRHRALFEASRRLFALISRLWDERACDPRLDGVMGPTLGPELLRGGARATVHSAAIVVGALPGPDYFWLRLAEDFVAMRSATFISHVLYHLRELMAAALLGALLLVGALAAYPFHPPRFIALCSWVVVAAVVIGGLVVIVRLERNEILSRLSGTAPGRVSFNFNFISELVVYVALPILALVATLVPEVSDQLAAWLDPLRRALR